MSEQGSSHPCHNLSNPSKRIFWCRHCMAKFVDPIQRWRHSKTCKRIISSNPKQELLGTDGKRLVVSAGTTEGSVVVSKDEDEEQLEPMVSRRKIRRLHMNDLVCQICKKEFYTLEEMREHVKNPCRKVLEGHSSTEIVKEDSLEKEDKEKQPNEYAKIEAGLRQMEESLAIRSDVADEIVANQIESLLQAAQVLQQQQQQEQQEAALDILGQLPSTETVIIQPDEGGVETEYIITTNPEAFENEYGAVTVETVGTVETIDPASVPQIAVCPETGLVHQSIPTTITEPDELQLISEVIAREEPELTKNCAFVPPSCRCKSLQQTETSSKVNQPDELFNKMDCKNVNAQEHCNTNSDGTSDSNKDSELTRNYSDCTKQHTACFLTNENEDAMLQCKCTGSQISNKSPPYDSQNSDKDSDCFLMKGHSANCSQTVVKNKKTENMLKKADSDPRISPLEKIRTRSLSKAERKVYPIRKRLKELKEMDQIGTSKRKSKLVLKCKSGLSQQGISNTPSQRTLKTSKIKKSNRLKSSPKPKELKSVQKSVEIKQSDIALQKCDDDAMKTMPVDCVDKDINQETRSGCDEVDGNNRDSSEVAVDGAAQEPVKTQSDKKPKIQKPPKQPKCKICDRVFKTPQLLQKHYKIPCKIKHTRNLCQKVLRPKQVLAARSQPTLKQVNNKKKPKATQVVERLHLLPVSSRRISDTTLMIPKSKKISKNKGRRKSAPSYICYVPAVKEYSNRHIGVHVLYKSLPDKEQFFFDLGMIARFHLQKDSENLDICVQAIEKDAENCVFPNTDKDTHINKDSEYITDLELENKSCVQHHQNLSPLLIGNDIDNDATPPPVLEKISIFNFDQEQSSSSWSDNESCGEPPELEFMSMLGVQAGKGGLLTRVYSPCESDNSLDSCNSSNHQEFTSVVQKSEMIEWSFVTSDFQALSSPVHDDCSSKNPDVFPILGEESPQNFKTSSNDLSESCADISELPYAKIKFSADVESDSNKDSDSQVEISVTKADPLESSPRLDIPDPCNIAPLVDESKIQGFSVDNIEINGSLHRLQTDTSVDECVKNGTQDISFVFKNVDSQHSNDNSQGSNFPPSEVYSDVSEGLILEKEAKKPDTPKKCDYYLAEKQINNGNHKSLEKNSESQNFKDIAETSVEKENLPNTTLPATKTAGTDVLLTGRKGETQRKKQKPERHFTDLLADLCTTSEVVFAPDENWLGIPGKISSDNLGERAQQPTKLVNRHFLDAISLDSQPSLEDTDFLKKSDCKFESNADEMKAQIKEKKLKNKVTVAIQTENNPSEEKVIYPSRSLYKNMSDSRKCSQDNDSCDYTVDNVHSKTCISGSYQNTSRSPKCSEERTNLFESLSEISPKRPSLSCSTSVSKSNSSPRRSLFDSIGNPETNPNKCDTILEEEATVEKIIHPNCLDIDVAGDHSKTKASKTSQNVEEIVVFPSLDLKILPQKGSQISSEFVSRTESVPNSLSNEGEQNRKGVMELVAESLGLQSVESSTELSKSDLITFTTKNCEEGTFDSSPVIVNSVETTSCSGKLLEKTNMQIIVMNSSCDAPYTSDVNLINLHSDTEKSGTNNLLRNQELEDDFLNALSRTDVSASVDDNNPQNTITNAHRKTDIKGSLLDSNVKVVMCGLEDLKPKKDEYILVHKNKLHELDQVKFNKEQDNFGLSHAVTSEPLNTTYSKSNTPESNTFSNVVGSLEHHGQMKELVHEETSCTGNSVSMETTSLSHHEKLMDNENGNKIQSSCNKCDSLHDSSDIPVRNCELETFPCKCDTLQDSQRVLVQYVDHQSDYLLLDNQVPISNDKILGKELNVQQTSYSNIGDDIPGSAT